MPLILERSGSVGWEFDWQASKYLKIGTTINIYGGKNKALVNESGRVLFSSPDWVTKGC